MNRGSHDDGAFRGHLILASMRPRFMNRGSHGWTHTTSNLGIRFNEAPIHESGKSSCCRSYAARGPTLQ